MLSKKSVVTIHWTRKNWSLGQAICKLHTTGQLKRDKQKWKNRQKEILGCMPNFLGIVHWIMHWRIRSCNQSLKKSQLLVGSVRPWTSCRPSRLITSLVVNSGFFNRLITRRVIHESREDSIVGSTRYNATQVYLMLREIVKPYLMTSNSRDIYIGKT